MKGFPEAGRTEPFAVADVTASAERAEKAAGEQRTFWRIPNPGYGFGRMATRGPARLEGRGIPANDDG